MLRGLAPARSHTPEAVIFRWCINLDQ